MTATVAELRARLLAAGVASMVEAVAVEHHTTLDSVLSRDRTALVSRARRRAFVLLRQRGFTEQGVGDLMGRDRTTVRQGVEKSLDEFPAGAPPVCDLGEYRCCAAPSQPPSTCERLRRIPVQVCRRVA